VVRPDHYRSDNMIEGYKPGSDITIMNTIYHSPKKDPISNKWSKDAITIVYKDNNTELKGFYIIEQPKYEFYTLKEGQQVDHNLFFIENDESKINKIEVPYLELDKEIAKFLGKKDLDFYYDNIRNRNRENNKVLHTNPRIFRSDTNIKDYYRIKFSELYTNNITSISKAYLDIEVDGIKAKGNFVDPGEVAINATTILTDEVAYTFLLRDKDNPLIEEFEKNLDNSFFIELKELIKETVGGKKKLKRYKLENLKHEIIFYDVEINLIKDIFNLINYKKPDFVLAWNMAFDIPYIIQRIKNLGYDPREIMCHPDFKYKECRYFVDERMKSEYAERGDHATISSYSVFIDQMIQFASRRKGQSVTDNFRLDTIGELVADVNKLSFKHLTNNIVKLPYVCYKTFVLYNIVDTIVQKCIEVDVEDIDYLFSKAVSNNTRYSKTHRQTIYLTNRGVAQFKLDGYILGNNVNKYNEKIPYAGAFVADPLKLSNYSKLKLNGFPIDIYDNADDFDYTRLYPSIMQEFNLAPNTQIGMLYIDNRVHTLENRSNSDKFSRSGAFAEDLSSKNYLDFCSRWLGLGAYEDLYNDVYYYMTNIRTPRVGFRFTNKPQYPIRKIIKRENARPIFKDEKNRRRYPLVNLKTLDKALMEGVKNEFNKVE